MPQAPLCGPAPRRCHWQPDVCHTINFPCMQINIKLLKMIRHSSSTHCYLKAIFHISCILVYREVFITEMPNMESIIKRVPVYSFICNLHVYLQHTHTHTHTSISRPSGLCPGLLKWASIGTNLDITEARDSEGSVINWAICKSAPHPRQRTKPAPLPTAEPTAP